MTVKNFLIVALSALFIFSFALSGCDIFSSGKLKITDIKMASAINEKLAPVHPTGSFPNGTSRVYCWFGWRNAAANTQLMAKWYYISENINILNYPFNIPNRDGSGSVLLAMPEGQTLPSGSYKIDLIIYNHIIKSCEFKIK